MHNIDRKKDLNIIAIGNSGSGRSTILNVIAGDTLFKSGTSLGFGLTNEVTEKMRHGTTYIDTPGIMGSKDRDNSIIGITKKFNEGGKMKILFFILQNDGRPVKEDVGTMKLILQAVPQIGANYGIIINKVNDAVINSWDDSEKKMSFLISLFHGTRDENVSGNVLLLPVKDALSRLPEKNTFITASEINPQLDDFVDRLPIVEITPNQVPSLMALEDFRREMAEKEVYYLENRDAMTVEKQKTN